MTQGCLVFQTSIASGDRKSPEIGMSYMETPTEV